MQHAYVVYVVDKETGCSKEEFITRGMYTAKHVARNKAEREGTSAYIMQDGERVFRVDATGQELPN